MEMDDVVELVNVFLKFIDLYIQIVQINRFARIYFPFGTLGIED